MPCQLLRLTIPGKMSAHDFGFMDWKERFIVPITHNNVVGDVLSCNISVAF